MVVQRNVVFFAASIFISYPPLFEESRNNFAVETIIILTKPKKNEIFDTFMKVRSSK